MDVRKNPMNGSNQQTNASCLLVVDDQESNIQIVGAALGKLGFEILPANGGLQAFQRLAIRRPDLILLDLNIPKKNGFEVLKEIKEDAELRRIPVAVLTTSRAEEDILHSYNLYANCFITKPIDFEQFTKVVKSIEDFWFTIVKLPDGEK